MTVEESAYDDIPSELEFDGLGQPEATNGQSEPRTDLRRALQAGKAMGDRLDSVVTERTVSVRDGIDEDEFFSTVGGETTIVNRYDLERAVPMDKKPHFVEEDRYWVNKPFACVVIFHSQKENERKYVVVEPYFTDTEQELQAFLSDKLKTAIKYSDDELTGTDEFNRAGVIERETKRLLSRYGLYDGPPDDPGSGFIGTVKGWFGGDDADDTDPITAGETGTDTTLSPYQVEKLLYVLKRDFVGYGKIDAIKHDINVEDISCNGYNSRVFVYHTDYEQIITNISHGETELDDFVVKLAQQSGKGISKRQPQVDATLPDGSRAQLTLGEETSDHGTNYTIRQFKDVPFTPVDLINWNTFSIDEMAFLWLCIENNKSLVFAGGTASGKTTSLNAISLFIPSNSKVVSIEDTREVELPQRNWVASVTRPSFGEDDVGDIDEFDLLEAALRQRPDYIVFGEVRGEEGRDLFQVMSTGHTTYTTFHADSVDEVIKRFTTEPINVSKTLFTALDLVSIQTQTRVNDRKVRRNKTLTEINKYSPEYDEVVVTDVFEWQPESDTYEQNGSPDILEEIAFDRGWSQQRLEDELFKRRVVLAYLIQNGLNTYTEVAATIQAFINDPETLLSLIATDQLERSLEDLREMESVEINADPEKEKLVPRPDPSPELLSRTEDILSETTELFDDVQESEPSAILDALTELSAGTEEQQPPRGVTDQ